MQPLNYHHLLYFWTVAREGSIAKASQALGLAQPTISGQIRALELSVGQQLFQRAGRNLVLTEIGTLTFRYADEIFGLGRELQETLRGQHDGGPNRVLIGVADQLPKLLVRRLLEPVLALATPMRVVVREGTVERLMGDLSIHALDVVLSDTPIAPTVKVRAFTHPLGGSPVSLFAVPTLAAAARRDFPHSLSGMPFLAPSDGSAMRRALERWMVALGIRPRFVAEVDDSGLMKSLGEAGHGVFAAPSVVASEIVAKYGVEEITSLADVQEQFYAISVDRQLTHPAVVAICEAARQQVFGGAALSAAPAPRERSGRR
jgi:LysR family transcriptional regulator, transcriptional activator of nhaA